MIPTYFNTTDCHQSFMNIWSAFVTNSQSAILVEPGQCSLNDPAVDTKTAAIFSSSFSQYWLNSFSSQLLAMGLRVIAAIPLNTIRSIARMPNLARYRRYCFNQAGQLCNIMAISTSQFSCKRQSLAISNYVVLRTVFASIRGIGACFRPPKTARTEAESTTAREKSIWSAWRNLFNIVWCILSHTPAFCQSRSRRQQVIPEPQPISCGRSSHAMPVLSTNKIPVRAARFETGFLPGYLNRRFFFGISGSTISHNSSSSIGLAMSSLLANFRYIQLLMLSAIYGKNISFC